MRSTPIRLPDIVVLFDDALTTGSHFTGIEIVLRERFPGVTVFGLFLARAVRPPNDKTFDLDF
jgi:predicted amidophosphoribosyltransferase